MKQLPVASFHAVLFCRKWHECIAFYRDVLGFTIVERNERFVEFQITAESRIGLLKPLRTGSSEIGDASFILSFRISNIERIHKELSRCCAEITAVKKHPWGANVFELRDPEGRRLEFWEPLGTVADGQNGAPGDV